MLRPSRRPSHSNEDLNGSSSSLDLNYGNAGGTSTAAAPSPYTYGAGAAAMPAPSYGGRKPAAVAAASDNNYSIYKDKPARRSGGAVALDSVLAMIRKPITLVSFLVLLMAWKLLSYRSQLNSLLGEFNAESVTHAREAFTKLQNTKVQLERDLARTKSQESQSTRKFIDMDKNVKALQRERDDLKKKLKSTAASPSPAVPQQQQVATLPSSKEEAYKELIQSLQAAVQRESRRAVLEKFGAPPYYIDMTVKLPSNLKEELTFTVELAPLEFMPHAVHLFLEQVAHGLWNGNAFFYVNGPHVIQCGPQATLKEGEVMPTPAEERQRALAPFQELQLDGLAFPEYSDNFTHLPWTLGFTGRPGGPDWYINKRNNTEEHGPGGVGSTHELSGDYGDPCFAKVVDGFDVVKSMFAEATIHSGDVSTQYYFEEPIQLIKLEIVGWNQQAAAEAAAIASNATIQHATGEKLDLISTIQAATEAGAIGNLTEAASKIAATLAEVGELQKKLEGLNNGPWNVKAGSQNREKQDSEQEAGASSPAGTSESADSTGTSEAHGLADYNTKSDKESDKAQVEIPDDGLPRPGDGSSASTKGEESLTKGGAAYDHADYGDNIDPQYASKPGDAAYIDIQPASSGGSAGGAEKKKKKELMMARS